MTARPVGILLAAGQSSRYRAATGRDKLTEIPSGSDRPVIRLSLDLLSPATSRVVAVIGPQRDDLAALLDHPACTVLRLESQGMGWSLAAAVAHAPSDLGWLIALADMPFIAPETVATVAAGLTPDKTVAPTHHGKRGHPVGIGAQFRDDLLALSGDSGARAILTRHPPVLVTGDVGCVTDMDTLLGLK